MIFRLFLIFCSIMSVQATEHYDIIHNLKASIDFKIVNTRQQAPNEDLPIEVERWVVNHSLNEFKDSDDFKIYLWTLGHMERHQERLYLQVQGLGTPLMGSLHDYLYEMYSCVSNINHTPLRLLLLSKLIASAQTFEDKRLFQNYYDKIKDGITSSK